MGFLRIQDREREAAERAWDRYMELLQQDQAWDAATEAEMRALVVKVGKTWEEMSADRKVVEEALRLQAMLDGRPAQCDRMWLRW